jgi:hypothetical protein
MGESRPLCLLPRDTCLFWAPSRLNNSQVMAVLCITLSCLRAAQLFSREVIPGVSVEHCEPQSGRSQLS